MSKKDDILNTALNLFIDKGLDNTPTSLISKETGVGTGTLFHHFKSKKVLINKLYLNLKRELSETLCLDIGKKKTVKDKMEYIWYEFTKWAIKNPKKYKFFTLVNASSYIEDSTREKAEELYRDFTEAIEEGYKQRLFRMQPRELFMAVMVGNMDATLTYFIANPRDFKKKKIVEGAYESFWRALTRE